MHTRICSKATIIFISLFGFLFSFNTYADSSDNSDLLGGAAVLGAAALIGVGAATGFHHSSSTNSAQPPSPPAPPTPNVIPDNYLPVEIINNNSIANNDNVYILVKGSCDGVNDYFLNLSDKTTGKATCDRAASGNDNFQHSYALSSLHVNPETKNPEIFIPKPVASGRMYFGVNYKFDMYTDPSTKKIQDIDGFNPRNSNYYTLFDKVEFSYNNNGSWSNPTAVDFFSMPIGLNQTNSTSGFTQAGLTDSRTNILTAVQNIFTTNDRTDEKMWNRLFLIYTSNAASNSNPNAVGTVLRMMSPGKAMAQGVPGTNPFDINYLVNSGGKVGALHYIDSLWSYYQTHDLKINCSELQQPYTILTGRVDSNNTNFIFKDESNNTIATIVRPADSMPFFSGSGETFNATDKTPEAIIVRDLTAAFDSGLLPLDSSSTSNGAILSKTYFASVKNHYYNDTPAQDQWGDPAKIYGPWYDLYAKSLHSFSNQPIYAFAYDDILSQDGTLHDTNGTRPSMLKITLGNMSGTTIPDPYTDSQTYTIHVAIGSGSTVVYKGTTYTSADTPTFSGVTIPFQVILNGNLANIYIKHPIVRPYFNGADGIVITQTGVGAANVTFPAPSTPSV